MTKEKTRVFVSFDFDNDKFLKDSIIGQSKNPDSPFDVADWSLKEAAPEKDWEKKAEERIKRVDVVMVMLGEKTYKAPGVKKEVKITREVGKPIFQIIGYTDKTTPSVEDAGKVYKWTWEKLKNLLS